MKKYFVDIFSVMSSIFVGMMITFRYFLNSFRAKKTEIVTIQYPFEMDTIPERHRGIHFLETQLCIVCYQCAMACPVDCIEIEQSKEGAVDGSVEGYLNRNPKSHLTKFAIDYGRCIFCHLCIEPCPTECIHMGKEFDWSGYTRADMVKNLLTDDVFVVEDHRILNTAREQAAKLDAEAKARKAAERKKKAAARKAKKAKEAAKKKKNDE